MVNIKQKETYFYDIEIFPNLLTITFVAKNSDKKEVFVFRDIIKGEDLKRLLLFLSNPAGLDRGYRRLPDSGL